jgi:tetratricopeptide (TPR) repeat protein
MQRPSIIIICALLAFCAIAEDAKPELSKAETAFKAGVALAKEGKFIEAVAEYEKALAVNPKDRDVMWNLGLASQSAGQLDLALDCWKKMREAEPDNWRVIAKLVQVYQAKDMKKERDEQRRLLVDMRDKNKLEFADQPQYCREQVKVGEKNVMVMEYYELKGDRALKYVFHVLNDKGDTDYRISLGSYEMTAAIMKEGGQVKDGDRGFHLDGYFNGGRTHKTYQFYNKEPSYDDVRPAVIKIIEGKGTALSGSEMKKDGSSEVQITK